jgi:uncharacterized membrane protein
MHSWTDRRVQEIIGNLLLAGVTLAGAVTLAGGAIYLIRHGGSPADYHIFHGEPYELRHIRGIVREAFAGRGRGVIQLGLLLLIATPIARVALSIVAFVVEKDRMYVVFTSIVLLVLLYSLLGY